MLFKINYFHFIKIYNFKLLNKEFSREAVDQTRDWK